jgi:hypothetical protein
MKKLHLIGMAAIFAIALASCGSEKKMANNQPQQQTYQQPVQQTNETTNQPPQRVRIDLPCKKEARSDKDYFRELGIGTDVNEQNARDAALSSANEMLKNRLGGVVKGVSTGYSKTVAGEAASDKVFRVMERELPKVVDAVINDADNPCEDLYWETTGVYKAYYVIEVSKKQIVDKSAEVLSEQEELKGLFDRNNFREWSNQYMSDMKEN